MFDNNPAISGRLHILGPISQDPSDKKKQLIKYGNIPLGAHFNFGCSKLKSDY